MASVVREQYMYSGKQLRIVQFGLVPENDALQYRRFKLKQYLEHKGHFVAYIDRTWLTLPKEALRKAIKMFSPDMFIFSDGKYSFDINEIKGLYTNVPVIYDCSDNWPDTIYPEPLYGLETREGIQKSEQTIVDCADLITCSAKGLVTLMKERYGRDALFIPNGIDTEVPSECSVFTPNRPAAAVVGCSSRKIDLDKLIELADANPDYDIHLFGVSRDSMIENAHKYDVLVARPNVQVQGYLPHAQLQDALSKCDVGIISFIDHPYCTRGMLPLKYFNYTLAGIPTAYWNCPECAEYPTAFNLAQHSLGEIAQMPVAREDYDHIIAKSNWKDKFELLMKEALNAKVW